MARARCACGGVPIQRTVATVDVTAFEADPQAQPFRFDHQQPSQPSTDSGSSVMLTWSSCVHVFIRGRSRVLHVPPVLRKLAEIFAHDADVEVEQYRAFLLGEVRERGP